METAPTSQNTDNVRTERRHIVPAFEPRTVSLKKRAPKGALIPFATQDDLVCGILNFFTSLFDILTNTIERITGGKCREKT